MARESPTTPPPAQPARAEDRVCVGHSGLLERVRGLTQRADTAAEERDAMRTRIEELRVEAARTMGRWSILVVALNALIAAAVLAAAKVLFGG
jgi:hypothetical protein